jgi:hypothetical protein
MKKVLIIFPDPHLPYSPTILNLYEYLKKEFDVTIVNFENRQFRKLDNPDIVYLSIPILQKKIFGFINKFSKNYGKIVMAFIYKGLLHRFLRNKNFEKFILTDPISLWLLPKGVKGSKHLVSLELTFNTNYFIKRVHLNYLSSIIIQSKERLDFVAPHFSNPVFYVQNAPVFSAGFLQKKIPDAGHFIFSGSAIPQFGIFQTLDFINSYSEYKITIIGNVPERIRNKILQRYENLYNQKRLLIESKYLSADEMLESVSHFRIGFCFYDFSSPAINNINYKTAPSGKMFTYFATGVPVIGINIPGLKPIEDFNAGVLIDDMKPETIESAVRKIEENYETLVKGCFKAAEYFSFDKRVEPFIHLLKTENQ